MMIKEYNGSYEGVIMNSFTCHDIYYIFDNLKLASE